MDSKIRSAAKRAKRRLGANSAAHPQQSPSDPDSAYVFARLSEPTGFCNPMKLQVERQAEELAELGIPFLPEFY